MINELQDSLFENIGVHRPFLPESIDRDLVSLADALATVISVDTAEPDDEPVFVDKHPHNLSEARGLADRILSDLVLYRRDPLNFNRDVKRSPRRLTLRRS